MLESKGSKGVTGKQLSKEELVSAEAQPHPYSRESSRASHHFFFNNFYLFVLAVLGFTGTWLSLVVGSRGYSLAVVQGAAHCVSFSCGGEWALSRDIRASVATAWTQQLQFPGSRVQAHLL